MRLAVYGATSSLLAAGVVLSAFQTRPNFYSACVYLAQSNACLMILANMGIFITVMVGRLVQSILFGSLRIIEIEHLYEKTWDEFDARFLVMFTTLLFLKIFHWLSADRVEYMEQAAPASPIVFHVRLSVTLVLLSLVDMYFIGIALEDILTRGPNMMVMFAFEFAILETTALAISGKYIISLIELRVIANSDGDEEGWEKKGEFMFRLDLVTDFVKLLIYISFFLLILTVYGLPLHIVRDVYLTMRSFMTRIRDFMRYRQATSQMNNRYPDATAEEVQRETTCIICREEMVVPDPSSDAPPQRERMKPKKLPCGHVLHFGCLRSWLERQQRCPTCRRPVLEATNRPQPQQPAQQPLQPIPELQVPQNAQFADIVPQHPQHVPQPFATPDPLYFEPMPYTQQPAGLSLEPMGLPAGYVLPPGWALLPLRQSSNGLQQIQIRDNVWLTISTVQYASPLGDGTVSVPPPFDLTPQYTQPTFSTVQQPIPAPPQETETGISPTPTVDNGPAEHDQSIVSQPAASVPNGPESNQE